MCLIGGFVPAEQRVMETRLILTEPFPVFPVVTGLEFGSEVFQSPEMDKERQLLLMNDLSSAESIRAGRMGYFWHSPCCWI